MKTLILLFLFSTLATCWKPINAGELSLSLGQRSMNIADDEYSVGDWNFIQLSYQPDNSKIYYFLSQEEAEVSPKYNVFTYTMQGFGVGSRYKVNNNIRFFGQIGYYKVKNDFGKRDGYISEGLLYYLNTRFYGAGNDGDYHVWRSYEVKSRDTFGGTIGVEFTQSLTKNITAGFSLSHRMIKIKQSLHAYWTPEIHRRGGEWTQQDNKDYSSTDFAVTINYEF